MEWLCLENIAWPEKWKSLSGSLFKMINAWTDGQIFPWKSVKDFVVSEVISKSSKTTDGISSWYKTFLNVTPWIKNKLSVIEPRILTVQLIRNVIEPFCWYWICKNACMLGDINGYINQLDIDNVCRWMWISFSWNSKFCYRHFGFRFEVSCIFEHSINLMNKMLIILQFTKMSILCLKP